MKTRDLFDEVWRYLGEDRGNRAGVLIGPRQVGKTNYNLEIDFVFKPARGVGVAIEVTGSPDVDGRKLERLGRASENAGAGRKIVVHNGLGSRTEGDVELVPAREFLLSPYRFIEGRS